MEDFSVFFGLQSAFFVVIPLEFVKLFDLFSDQGINFFVSVESFQKGEKAGQFVDFVKVRVKLAESAQNIPKKTHNGGENGHSEKYGHAYENSFSGILGDIVTESNS